MTESTPLDLSVGIHTFDLSDVIHTVDLSDGIHTLDLSDGIHTLDQTAVTLCCGLLGQARACLMNRFTFSCQCFIVPFGKFGSPYLGRAQQAARAAIPIPIDECCISVCPDSGMAVSVWDF